ncbi:MAG: aminoacyl-tRNA hydrolase [Acidobacteriota bacterium]
MDLKAVIGLGNPGPEFAATRHNVGFRVVDELARRWRLDGWVRRYRSLIGRRAGGRGVWLAKPQTFMNLSGEAVAAFCAAEALDPHQCLVVVDDVELALGQLRLRSRGGSGTHNGLRSLVAAVGEGFVRLRVGVQGTRPWHDLADYVLAPFDADEGPVVDVMVGRAADCVEMALHAGVSRAASLFNRTETLAGEDRPDGGAAS